MGPMPGARPPRRSAATRPIPHARASTRGERAAAAGAPRIAIVVSRYNASITDRLLEGARHAYALAGGRAEDLLVVEAPGAFELPALALAAATKGNVRGVVTLGCVIRGETKHDQYIAQAVAHGVVEVTLRTGIPVAFGVLTTENVEQAEARAGGAQGNKGAEAMEAVLQTIAAADAIGAGGSPKAASARRPDKAARGGTN
jgi:6,7-dimethyl-8-ribityllumazine synthase